MRLTTLMIRVLLAVTALSLAACGYHRHRMPKDTAGEMRVHQCAERENAMRRMADMCANQLQSMNETRQEVEAAQTGNNATRMKAALGKAAAELSKASGHFSMCCEHMKRMGDASGCGCPHMGKDDAASGGCGCKR